MTKFDPQLHHRRSIRLKGYDYALPGAYFVTLVAWQRECLFGEVVGGVMRLNPAGKMIHAEWQTLPRHFPNIRLGAFVVMPNHFHGIIMIDPPVGATHPSPDETWNSIELGADQARVSPDGSPLQTNARTCPDGSPLPRTNARPNGPPAGSIGAMIGQFKSRVTKRIWGLPGAARIPVWQRNYYEHIIRNEKELARIAAYIQNNPTSWEKDRENPARITPHYGK